MALSLRRRPKTLFRHQCRRIVRLLHRSCPLSFVDWRTVDVFLEYVLPRLNCSIRGCFTSTWPVSFSGQTAHHYLLQPPSPVLPWIVLHPFSFPGVAKTGHPLSFVFRHSPKRQRGGSPSLTLGAVSIKHKH